MVLVCQNLLGVLRCVCQSHFGCSFQFTSASEAHGDWLAYAHIAGTDASTGSGGGSGGEREREREGEKAGGAMCCDVNGHILISSHECTYSILPLLFLLSDRLSLPLLPFFFVLPPPSSPPPTISTF